MSLAHGFRLLFWVPIIAISLLGIGISALLFTERGAIFLIDAANDRVDDVHVDYESGTVMSGIVASLVTYNNEQINVRANRVEATLNAAQLLGGELVFRAIKIDALNVQWNGSDVPAEAPAPFSMPIALDVRETRIGRTSVRNGDSDPIVLDQLTFRLRLRGDTLTIDASELRQQDLAASGNFTLGLNPPLAYSGQFETLATPNLGPYETSARGTFEGNDSAISINAALAAGQSASLVAIVRYAGTADVRLITDIGRLDADVRFESGDTFSVNAGLFGVLMGYGVAGQLDFAFAEVGPSLQLNLSQEANSIDVNLSPAGQLVANATLPQLEKIHPEFDGDARVRAIVDIPHKQFEATTFSRAFHFQQIIASDVIGSASGILGEALTTNLSVASLRSGDVDVGSGSTNYEGSFEIGSMAIDWRRGRMSINGKGQLNLTALQLELEDSLLNLSADESPLQQWTLLAPTTIRLVDEAVTLTDHCWSSAPTTLCLSQLSLSAASSRADFLINELTYESVVAPLISGSVMFSNDRLVAGANAAELNLAAPFSLTDIVTRIEGPLDNLSIKVNGGVFQGETSIAGLGLSATLTDTSFNIETFNIRHALAEININGQYQFSNAMLDLAIDGTAIDRPLTGKANFALTNPSRPAGELTAAFGETSTPATLHLATTTSGTMTSNVSIPALQSIERSLFGSVKGSGNLDLNTLAFDLRIDADGVGNESATISRVETRANGHLRNDVSGSISVNGVTAMGRELGDGSLTISGTPAAFVLGTTIKGQYATLALQSGFAWENGAIRGAFQNSQLAVAGQTWSLDERVPFRAGPNTGFLADHCWRYETGRFCVSNARYSNADARINLALNDAPIRFGGAVWAPEVRIDGGLNASFAALATAPFSLQTLAASLNMDVPALAIRYFDEDTLTWDIGSRLDVRNGEATLQLDGKSEGINQLAVKTRIPDIAAPDKLNASANFRSNSLGIVTAFVPELDRAEGAVSADFIVNTLAAEPVANLSLAIEPGARVVIPAAGIELTNIAFLAKGNADRIDLNFSGNSGEGAITASGQVDSPLDAERSLEVRIQGDRFRALERSDLAVTASPDVEFLYQGTGSGRLRGKVIVNDGRLNEILAQSRSTSPDVVVVARAPEANLLGQLDVELALSVEHFLVDLYGLKGDIQGAVNLAQRPGTPRRATGNVNLVSGAFSRYGQTFEVERGRLIFAGPVTNPLVDVVTSRTIEEAAGTIKVTLTLSGPANNIRSSITATPAMSEARALSYLIIGRPLQSANAGDQQALTAAALGLGLKQAAPVTEEIRKTLGLEALTIGSNGLSSTTVIAGKQLSRDLYVEYSYDVMGRVGGILFEYKLSDRLSLQTRSGEQTSTELIYTIE